MRFLWLTLALAALAAADTLTQGLGATASLGCGGLPFCDSLSFTSACSSSIRL